MNIFVGTSGFSYKEWKGRFYPKALSTEKMLAFYASRFSAVEINNTYYRFPAASALDGWAGEVPERFRFAIKAPKAITEGARWNASAMAKLVEVSARLGEKRGPFFVRLPDGLKKDATRLRAFVEALPRDGARFTFDFRHESWFDDETFTILRARNAALCWSESESLVTPSAHVWQSTSSFGYIRLRSAHYELAELAAWAERILAQPWSDAFVFFRHEDEGRGPELGAQLLEIFARATENPEGKLA